MKCIEKAMNETECNPRRKWWGYVCKETGYRYLCRYNHTFAVFSSTEVLYSNYETVTDKRGVLFAINYFKKKTKNESSSSKNKRSYEAPNNAYGRKILGKQKANENTKGNTCSTQAVA